MRNQITLRLSADEIAILDAAAARLRLDRAALIRAAALGVSEVVLAATPPLVLMADPAAVLERTAARLGAGSVAAEAEQPSRRSRR